MTLLAARGWGLYGFTLFFGTPLGRLVTQEEIARRAYEIYQREGCPFGRQIEHWAQAEIELGVTS